MARADDYTDIYPLWGEILKILCEGSEEATLPSEIETSDKYKKFLYSTVTPLAFDNFVTKLIAEYYKYTVDQMKKLIRSIAGHLNMIHCDLRNNFMCVYRMFCSTLEYINMFKNDKDVVDALQSSRREHHDEYQEYDRSRRSGRKDRERNRRY